MATINSQRFCKGEIFCYLNPFDSSLPVCAKDEAGKFVRLHETFQNWLDGGYELFHKIPGDQLYFGFVCEYEPELPTTHPNFKQSESSPHAFFGILFVGTRFHMIRLEDNNPHLWKVINFEQELIQNSKGAITTLSTIKKLFKPLQEAQE